MEYLFQEDVYIVDVKAVIGRQTVRSAYAHWISTISRSIDSDIEVVERPGGTIVSAP
jgi:hypothetical protein